MGSVGEKEFMLPPLTLRFIPPTLPMLHALCLMTHLILIKYCYKHIDKLSNQGYLLKYQQGLQKPKLNKLQISRLARTRYIY